MTLPGVRRPADRPAAILGGAGILALTTSDRKIRKLSATRRSSGRHSTVRRRAAARSRHAHGRHAPRGRRPQGLGRRRARRPGCCPQRRLRAGRHVDVQDRGGVSSGGVGGGGGGGGEGVARARTSLLGGRMPAAVDTGRAGRIVRTCGRLGRGQLRQMGTAPGPCDQDHADGKREDGRPPEAPARTGVIGSGREPKHAEEDPDKPAPRRRWPAVRAQRPGVAALCIRQMTVAAQTSGREPTGESFAADASELRISRVCLVAVMNAETRARASPASASTRRRTRVLPGPGLHRGNALRRHRGGRPVRDEKNDKPMGSTTATPTAAHRAQHRRAEEDLPDP